MALCNSLETASISDFIKQINTILASIPYQLFSHGTEAIFHSTIFIILKLLGIYISCEISNFRGRADAIIETDKFTYIFEFKVNSTAQKALKQIEDKGYSKQLDNQNKKIISVGISFDTGKREITDWAQI